MADYPRKKPTQIKIGDDDTTHPIELANLFNVDITSSGSFDVRGDLSATSFGKLLQAIPIPVLLIDQSQDIVAANKAWALFIPNYKGRGGIFGDFLHCVRTRERPFRDIEVAHRTATLAHLGNIAYWLNRPLKWNPSREEIIGDPEASRWLDRAKREPWSL